MEVKPAMSSLWQKEKGQLTCCWLEIGENSSYNPDWWQQAVEVSGSYLEPLTDFASHSPFAGAEWFLPAAHHKPH